jgi:3-hydroxybutyrate dehydrogenase
VVFADLGLRPEAQSLVDEYKGKAVFQRTDVTSWADLDQMFKTALDTFGSIDIVCPGAGVFEPPFSNFWIPPGTGVSKDKPQGDRYAALDINITHPIRVTQMAISHWLNMSPPVSTSNPKTVVHIASIAAEVADLGVPMYYAAKHAVKAFVKSMTALEEHFGIRVACVLPGVVKTPLWTDHPEKLKMVKQEGQDKDEWVTPEETAQVMLNLVKDNEMTEKISGGGSNKVQIRGGTCLEVLCDHVRDVPLLNNVGPGATGVGGASVQNGDTVFNEVIDSLKTKGWGLVEGQTNGKNEESHVNGKHEQSQANGKKRKLRSEN